MGLALAISGGVDSMALAILFSEYQKTFPTYRIGNYPLNAVIPIVIDHGLREGSTQEAEAVVRSLQKYGMKGMVRSLRWYIDRETGFDPRKVPSVEGMARKMRYWYLGMACRVLKSPFLFTAHHQDDQYETILMRLLGGHNYRGLQGIKPCNDMPEVHGIYDVNKSGMVQDQKSENPFIRFDPTIKETKRLRNIFKDEKIAFGNDEYLWETIDAGHFHRHLARPKDPLIPYLTPIPVEDGGVRVVRPLLEYDKDRLRATCEYYKVQWWEDHTNQDQTLTPRNAVRHLVRDHVMPEALQKPAILSLNKRLVRRYDYEEAEARRVLTTNAVARNFDPCAGTMIIELPTFRKKTRNGTYDDNREKKRIPHRRVIAALAVRRLIEFITPYKALPNAAIMGNVVSRLFPELATDEEDPPPPTTFLIGGVMFEPIIRENAPLRWFLSRAPFPHSSPPPSECVDWRKEREPRTADSGDVFINPFINPKRESTKVAGWRRLRYPKLWDSRYWFSLGGYSDKRFFIRPYTADHARTFRNCLPEEKRERLAELLRHYAPNKVRTTLPALYITDDAAPRHDVQPHHLTMIALPTLGIHLDGLEEGFHYESSYKKVDTSLLGHKKRELAGRLDGGYTPSFSRSRRKRWLRGIFSKKPLTEEERRRWKGRFGEARDRDVSMEKFYDIWT